MRFALALLRRADGNVLLRTQADILVGHHVAAHHRDIFTADINRSRREHRAHRQCLAKTVFGACQGAGCQPFAETGMIALFVMLLGLGGQEHIPARRQRQRAIGLYRTGSQGDRRH
ncbi:Uncharacterised protein [Yersinia similis]|nr:Uncharacterised protein [Yersinia similis]